MMRQIYGGDRREFIGVCDIPQSINDHVLTRHQSTLVVVQQDPSRMGVGGRIPRVAVRNCLYLVAKSWKYGRQAHPS